MIFIASFIFSILFYIFPLVFIAYLLLILFYWYYWEKYEIKKHNSSPSEIFVSIVVIGRNESNNLGKCINSILTNDYSKSQYEIIYIDDFSSDNSIELLEEINSDNFLYFELKEFIGIKRINNYKKAALQFAISKANGEIILQTDADTWVGKNWIATHVNCYSNDKINFVTGPVLFKSNHSLLEEFQKHDFITTMGVTCAGISSRLHYMANGANMSYRKSVVDSYVYKSKHASGDDMFLVQNIAISKPESVMFLKNNNAIVYTNPEKTINSFINQRLRWATKTNSYKSLGLKWMVMLVFIVNFLLLINFVLLPILSFEEQLLFYSLLILKLVLDLAFILNIARFFGEKVSVLSLIVSLLLYPFYISFVGIKSVFVSEFKWKDRVVK